MSINITSAHHPIVYVPLVGSVISLVHLFNKCVILPCLSNARVQNSHYFSWLKEESGFRLVGLMIPLWGTALVWLYDYVMKEEAIMNMGWEFRDFSKLAPWLKNNMDVVKAACAVSAQRIQYVDDDVALRYMRDMMVTNSQRFDAALPHLKDAVKQILLRDTSVLSSFIYRTPEHMQLVSDDVALPFMRERIEENPGDFLILEAHLSDEVKKGLVPLEVLTRSFDEKPEFIKYATDEIAFEFMQEKMQRNLDVFWTVENHLSDEVKKRLVTVEVLTRSFNEKPEFIKYATDEIAFEFMQEKMQRNLDVFWTVENHLSKQVKTELVTGDVLRNAFNSRPEIIKYATRDIALDFMQKKMQNNENIFWILTENYLEEDLKEEFVTEEALNMAFDFKQYEIIKYVEDEVALGFLQVKLSEDPTLFLHVEKHISNDVKEELITKEILENLFKEKPHVIKYAPYEVALDFMQEKMQTDLNVFLIVEYELSKDVKKELVTKEVLKNIFDSKPSIIQYVTNEIALEFMQEKIKQDPTVFWKVENYLNEEVKKALVNEGVLQALFNDKPQIIKYVTDEIAGNFIQDKIESALWLAADYLGKDVRARFKLNDIEYARGVIRNKPNHLRYFDKEVILVLVQEKPMRLNHVPVALLGSMGILQEITKETLPTEFVEWDWQYINVNVRLELIRNNPILFLKKLAKSLANRNSYPSVSSVTFFNLDGSAMRGSDAGGLSRTLFSEIGEAIKPFLAPFKRTLIEKEIQVSNGSRIVQQPVEEKIEVENEVYQALGYLMGVAFINKTPTGLLFSPVVYDLLVAIRNKKGIFQAYQALWKSNELDPLEKEKMRYVNLSFEVIELLKNPAAKPNLGEAVDFDEIELSDEANQYFDQIEKLANFIYPRIKNNKPEWWGDEVVPDIENLYNHGDWIIEQVRHLNLNQKNIENNIVEGVKKGKFGLIAGEIFNPKINNSGDLRITNAEDLRLKIEGSYVTAQALKNLFSIQNKHIKLWMHRWFDEHTENPEMLKKFLWAATGSKTIVAFGGNPSCSNYSSGGLFKFATCSCSCSVDVDSIKLLGELKGVIEDRKNKEKENRYRIFKENLEADLLKLEKEGFNVL